MPLAFPRAVVALIAAGSQPSWSPEPGTRTSAPSNPEREAERARRAQERREEREALRERREQERAFVAALQALGAACHAWGTEPERQRREERARQREVCASKPGREDRVKARKRRRRAKRGWR